jgi:hypothetical protein
MKKPNRHSIFVIEESETGAWGCKDGCDAEALFLAREDFGAMGYDTGYCREHALEWAKSCEPCTWKINALKRPEPSEKVES